MDIAILTSSEKHPIFSRLKQWCEDTERLDHHATITTDLSTLTKGDFLFLISCSEFVPHTIRSQFTHTLVVHASDLPVGRGWSPHIWQILEGKTQIVVSLLSAEDEIDTGDIWLQEEMFFEGHEIWDEINEKLFEATLSLMSRAILECDHIKPKEQSTDGLTYYERRTPKDSQIDPKKSIVSQFNLLRVSDPNRFPAFFDHQGKRYKIIIEKIED